MTRPSAPPRLGRRRALPLLAFLLLALLFTWPLWTPLSADRMSVGPAGGDFLRQFHAYRAFVARAWAAGQPPLWNPHQYAGTPAWADPQQAVLYPWRLLQVPLALGGRSLPLWALHLEVLAHLALAGAFTYGLLRQLGSGPAGAALAGLGYTFGGYLSGYPMEQLAVLNTATWLPALLWALTACAQSLAAREPWRRPSLLAAGALAMMVLAGHPQTALYGLWAAAAWWLWRVASLRGSPGAVRDGLLASILWLGGGLGLSAAQWLPSAELLRRSARSLDPAELAAGFPPRDFLQVFAPGGLSQWSPLYVGLPLLGLALWGGWRLRRTRPWLVLAGLAGLVSLGGHNPAFPVLLRILPGMALFRHQERLAVLWSLGLAVAAGLALDALLEAVSGQRDEVAGEPAHRSAFTTGRLDDPIRLMAALAGLCALAAAALQLRYAGAFVPVEDFCRPETLVAAAERWSPAGRRLALAGPLAHAAGFAALAAGALWLARRGRLSRRGLTIALLGIALLDLFGANRGTALCPLDPGRLEPDANLAQLLPRAREGRVSSEALLPGGPNAASLFGLYDVTGDSPLQLGRTAGLIAEAPEILWWRLLNVRFAVTDRPPEGAPLSEIAHAGAAALYEVQLPVPPVWVPTESRCAEALWSWVEPSLDPQALAYVGWVDADALASELPIALPRSRFGTTRRWGRPAAVQELCLEGPGAGTARLTGLDPGRIRVEAEMDAPGWLILSSAYDPGWRLGARNLDDGRRIAAPVAPAFDAVLAAYLPAGRWELRWTYLPSAVIMGLLTSLVTLGAGLWSWRRTRETSS